MLVSLADMKTYLGIDTLDTSQDAFLTEQLTLVSDAVEAYCRRVFTEDEYIQTYYKNDYPISRQLLTFHYPVSAIDSIVEDGVTVDAADYRLQKGTGSVIKPYGNFYIAEETVVTYTAGYISIPSPVLNVVKSVVEERYNKKISGVTLNFGSDVQRISIPGSISIDFDYSLSNNDRKTSFGVILGSHVNVLDFYRSDRAIVGSGKLEYVEEAP